MKRLTDTTHLARHPRRFADDQQGFILIIVCMVLMVMGIAVFAYMRVSAAH
jgi:Tfp pilus assembly protein PilX